MNRHVNLLAGTLAAAVALSPLAARAECVAPGFNPSGNFCDGCKYEGTMSMRRDEMCNRVYMPAPTAGAGALGLLEIFDHRLVQRAKHGVAGLNANTFAYAPAKGYVGPDDFTIEVLYRQGGKKYGKFQVHWNVTVQ